MLILLLILTALFASCAGGPEAARTQIVLELPQPQYNVALAIANSVSRDSFLRTAEEISVIYRDDGLFDAATQVGEIVQRLFPIEQLSGETLSRYIDALGIVSRGAPSAETVRYQEEIFDDVVANGSPRLLADLFIAATEGDEPDATLLRSILDELYTAPIAEERTTALVRVARRTAERGVNNGVNPIIQQTIPTYASSGSPIREVGNLIALSRFSLDLQRPNDADDLRSRALERAEGAPLQATRRDLPILYTIVDDLARYEDFGAATRIIGTVEPYRSRALGYLRLAAYADEKPLLQRSFLELASEATRRVEAIEDRRELAGMILLAYGRSGIVEPILDGTAAMRELASDGAGKAYLLAALLTSDAVEEALEIARSSYGAVDSDVTTLGIELLSLLLDEERRDLAESLLAFLRDEPGFRSPLPLAVQLARMGRYGEALENIVVNAVAAQRNRDSVIATLVAIPPSVEMSPGERSDLSTILEMAFQ